jgi:FlaA1/EpsC-like NDP-sugar epimerase/lipopolysaccharide/colanic/teichoic acid biosynthesis glycosyltransferase
MFVTKRIIDILLSLVGIILFFPLMPIFGLLIKLDSKGPVFYRTNRVGKDMKVFKMYKFRTMVDTPDDFGASVCPQFDPRVTFFGRFLRRTKLNELPQFFNILKGEMTFVGPRPEAPDLAELYPQEAKRVFSVKPGLVGPSTVIMRNEEERYPPGVDVNKFYIEHILPGKINLDLAYIDNPTFFKDFKFILSGVKETLLGAISKKHLTDNRSQIYLFIADFCLVVFVYLFACSLNITDDNNRTDIIRIFVSLSFLIPIRLCCNIYFGLYGSIIRYISYHEIFAVIKAVTCGSFLIFCLAYLFGINYYSNQVALINWAFLMFCMAGFRFGLRFYWEKKRSDTIEASKRRVLIYGASDDGYRALHTIGNNKYSPFETVGFIDDNPEIYGKAINGLKVLGNRYHIKELARLYRVNEMIITEQVADPERILEIIKMCRESDLKCRILSFFKNINDSGLEGRKNLIVRNVEFSDILPLDHIQADHEAVNKIVAGKTVLINSSAGALGLELCRKLMGLGCSRLIIVDRYESYLNETVAGLSKNFNNPNIIPVLIDTVRIRMLEDVFKRYSPDIVIQAGMRKYEPLYDVQLEKICRTYYSYTMNLAKLAVTYKCEFFVMISSLMAGQGGSLIIDLLRKAEVKLSQIFENTNTCLIISRLGDIAENQGGIVSLLEKQIVDQRTVILPSEKTNCCLITKYSAAEFILQNIVEEKNKFSDECIFICNSGSSISLIELTQRLANYHGLNLWTDLEVRYIGQSEKTTSLTSNTI